MTQFSTAARSGTCETCHVALTYVLSLQALPGRRAANPVPYSCPKCGHEGILEAQPGQRIIRIETKLYASHYAD
jgi:hypothetical protein